MTPDIFDEQGEYMCPCYSCPNGTVQMDCKAQRIASALRSADAAGYRRGVEEAAKSVASGLHRGEHDYDGLVTPLEILHKSSAVGSPSGEEKT